MSEQRDKVRCRECELVQWRDHKLCRRCSARLPEPIVKLVERIVERVVIREDPRCLENLDEAQRLIVVATDRLMQQRVEGISPARLAHLPNGEEFPTLAEAEQALIAAAYQRSNRRPLEAARLLGIGKTTMYRKLKELHKTAA